MRPRRPFQSSARHFRAACCFAGSASSTAYRNTLESTKMSESAKTGAVMGLLARQVATVAAEKRLAPQRPPHRFLIGVLGGHPFLEQLSQQPRNAGIPAGSFDAGPLGDIFFKGH